MVYVLSIDGQPLMPTKEARARRFLKRGKARVVRKHPFTIQLTYQSELNVQPDLLPAEMLDMFKKGDNCMTRVNMFRQLAGKEDMGIQNIKNIKFYLRFYQALNDFNKNKQLVLKKR